MQLRLLAAGLLLIAGVANADDIEARSRLAGTWISQGERASGETWTLQEDEGKLRITHKRGGAQVSDAFCKPTGEECKLKEGGRDAKVSMWYSGPKLVQLWSIGSNVVKKRFGVADDGNTLEIEVIPVVPPGKTESARFTRSPEP